MYARFGSLYLALYLAQRHGLPADATDEAEREPRSKGGHVHALHVAGWLGLGAVMLAAFAAFGAL